MNKNHRLPFRQDNIRLAIQILYIQTKPETGGVEHLPDRDFRLRILTTNPAHTMIVLLYRDDPSCRIIHNLPTFIDRFLCALVVFRIASPIFSHLTSPFVPTF